MNRASEPDARAGLVTTAAETKKAIVAAGLEVYRARGEVVHLADRVRENLLMDAGAFIRAGAAMAVGVVVRAQSSDFPGEDEAQLFARARAVAANAIAIGYREVTAQLHTVADPGDPTRILDTWCELSLEKPVTDLAAAIDEVRGAVAFDKAVPR
jgi:hypothetical protein